MSQLYKTQHILSIRTPTKRRRYEIKLLKVWECQYNTTPVGTLDSPVVLCYWVHCGSVWMGVKTGTCMLYVRVGGKEFCICGWQQVCEAWAQGEAEAVCCWEFLHAMAVPIRSGRLGVGEQIVWMATCVICESLFLCWLRAQWDLCSRRERWFLWCSCAGREEGTVWQSVSWVSGWQHASAHLNKAANSSDS